MNNENIEHIEKGLKRKICNGLEKYFTGKYRNVEMTRLGKKVNQRLPIYSYNGEEMTILEFGKKYNTKYYNILNRMKAGSPLGNKARTEKNLVEYMGKMVDIHELAKTLSTSVGHLKYNLSQGYEIDRPHATYSLRDKDGIVKKYRLVDIAEEYCMRNNVEKNHGVISMIRQRLLSRRIETSSFSGACSIEELTVAKKN